MEDVELAISRSKIRDTRTDPANRSITNVGRPFRLGGKYVRLMNVAAFMPDSKFPADLSYRQCFCSSTRMAAPRCLKFGIKSAFMARTRPTRTWMNAVTSIPVTQFPVGNPLPAETDKASASDSESIDETGSAETAASFAALLLQQTSAPVPSPETPITDVVPSSDVSLLDATSPVHPENADVLPTNPAEQLDLQSFHSPAQSDVELAANIGELPPELADGLVPSEITTLEGSVADESEGIPSLEDPFDTAGVYTEDTDRIDLREATLESQQLEDPDLESAELLEDVETRLSDERPLATTDPISDFTRRSFDGSTQSDDAALADVAVSRVVKKVDSGSQLNDGRILDSAAETGQGNEATAAVSLDSLSTEIVTTADAFVPTPQPVHGLQKIVNELIAEAETVVDTGSISVKFEEPHIGSVFIQMSETEDGLAVRVAADDDLTLEMLNSGSQQLESTLKDNNIELLEISSLPPEMNFQHSGHPDSPFHQQAPQIYRETAQHGQSTVAPGAVPRRLAASEKLDFRA